MRLSTGLFAGACALALSAFVSTAANAGVSGTIDATYGNGSNGFGSIWGGNAAAAFDLDWSGIGLEANVGYQTADISGGDSWDYGGSVVWTGTTARVAGSVIHYDNTFFNETTYGGGLVFFPSESFDFYAQGGGISGTLSGSYFGGGINWYITPDIGLNGDIDYGTLAGVHETDYSLKAEWLVSESTPISVNGGWKHTELLGDTTNIWFIGLKLYMNDGGAQTLPDRKHSGALNDIAPIQPVAFTL